MRLLALFDVSIANSTQVASASACIASQPLFAQEPREREPTFHRRFVVPVLHRAAICRGLLLGATREDSGQGAEDVEIETGLCDARKVSHGESSVKMCKPIRTLALALVLCSRLSTIPDREDGATSSEDFLETAEEDMAVEIGSCERLTRSYCFTKVFDTV